MPLPEGGNDVRWPPPGWLDVYDKYTEHGAWYSGDPSLLVAYYSTLSTTLTSSAVLWRTNFDRFWSRAAYSPQRRLMLHVPIAADIATTSADLLFSEPPEFVIEEAHEDPAPGGAVAAQDRLNVIVEEGAVIQTLLEAAELCSALGGVFLRVTWDREVAPDWPMLTAVDVDSAIPEFQWGRLRAVTFWHVLEEDNTKVIRHLERHEPGVVLHAVYQGTTDRLGVPLPLAAFPELGLAEPQVETGTDNLTAVYVPNMRPNRRLRGSPLGRSDYESVEPMMDSLDETWTSWMRDLRLARARLIVPQEFLQPQGKGKGATFDLDQEVYETFPMAITRDSKDQITPSQFEIRSASHSETAKALVERIVSASGYSASTFGLQGDVSAVTATEIINRERRTFVTRGKKMGYWQAPLARILEVLLQVDAAQRFDTHEVYRPRVDFADSVQEDLSRTAATVDLLVRAEAISLYTRVKMVNPEWTEEEVQAEVERIQADTGRSVPALETVGEGQPAVPGANGQNPPPPAPGGGPPMMTDEERARMMAGTAAGGA